MTDSLSRPLLPAFPTFLYTTGNEAWILPVCLSPASFSYFHLCVALVDTGGGTFSFFFFGSLPLFTNIRMAFFPLVFYVRKCFMATQNAALLLTPLAFGFLRPVHA